MENKVIFHAEDNEEIIFSVLEQTTLNGVCYLLVTEEMDADESEAYILKDISDAEDTEAVYDIVEDEEELSLIGEIFGQLLEDDIDIIL